MSKAREDENKDKLGDKKSIVRFFNNLGKTPRKRKDKEASEED
jgi:hypothetical protein